MSTSAICALPPPFLSVKENEDVTKKAAPKSVLSFTDQEVLSNLGKTKRAIHVLVRRGHEFFSNLPGLCNNLANDVALVAFVPEGSKKNISFESQRNFDCIVFYDDADTIYEEAQTLDDVKIPKLHLFADELCRLVPAEKVNFIHIEETSMSEVCRVREKNGLKGVYIDEVKHMRHKELMYRRAESFGITISPTVYIDFSQYTDPDLIQKLILKKLKIFPFFAKPTMMVAAMDATKLETPSALTSWIEKYIADTTSNAEKQFVVQNYVTGREFTIVSLLTADGSWKPLIVKYVAAENNYECLKSGRPIIAVLELFDEANKNSFPNIYKFGKKVVEAFKPPGPQLFMIQGFQLENGTDNYLLNELSYRPAGERTNAVLYDACGIDQYSALILASIDPCYVPLPSHLWKPKIVSSVWYTYKKGVLRTRNEVPKQPDVSGSITKVEWFVSVGKVMPNAKCYCCNLIMKFVLESNSAEERDKDLKWIDANWKPDVVEFLEEM